MNFQNESHSYFTSLKSIYHIASKNIQSDTKRVEIVEIQDEKSSTEINGAQAECKSKSDSRWSDNKVAIKKELNECDKDKKCDNKVQVKKEVEEEKEKK